MSVLLDAVGSDKYACTANNRKGPGSSLNSRLAEIIHDAVETLWAERVTAFDVSYEEMGSA
ncbi:hypothetical protein [Pseudomonas sp. GM80]|uniref:hypothetical protein n=1 Tax=Pseudomonas sp. GM80 TaxID=1144339 RepID=UPI0012F6F92B|nr:hypothetical protein [Pseudomonas sp. GM80]